MTSGQFNADLFAMANGKEFAADATYSTFFTEYPEYDATAYSLTLVRTPVEGTVSIAGLDPSTTDKDGTARTPDFTVSGKVITIASGSRTGLVDGQAVEVMYEAVVNGANKIDIQNDTAAVGEAVFKWPVYASGEDCTESSIKGFVVVSAPRCRVTQQPGFDTSYKSAATNSCTWSALDPKQGKATWTMAYFPNEGDNGDA